MYLRSKLINSTLSILFSSLLNNRNMQEDIATTTSRLDLSFTVEIMNIDLFELFRLANVT